MTSIFPKQPGYHIYHDPTKVDFKKISSIVLQNKNNGDFKFKKEYPLPRQSPQESIQTRDGSSLSYSQATYINHYPQSDQQLKEHFQPDWVKLDKQVLRFNGYFKESVDESKTEHARIRQVVILYYLVDDTIEITEPKEVNSGIPQGLFLKRAKVLKYETNKYKDSNSFFKYQDNRSSFFTYADFFIGSTIFIYGKYITLYDCDQYTREFYNKIGIDQPEGTNFPIDSYHSKILNKPVVKKDNLMKDWLEHGQGGGKVKNQKQFLENDRRVLKFNASHDSLKYVINYYLADDSVEIKELFFPNSGRRNFPLFLKRNKLPKKFNMTQPGEINEAEYVTPIDIEPFMTLWAFNRPFRILGCDKFTHDYYLEKFQKKFPIGGFEDVPTKDKSSKYYYSYIYII